MIEFEGAVWTTWQHNVNTAKAEGKMKQEDYEWVCLSVRIMNKAV